MRAMRVGIDLLSERGVPGGVHTYSNRLIEALAEAARKGDGAAPEGMELVVFIHDDFRWLFPVEGRTGLRIVRSGRSGLSSGRRRLLQQTMVPRLARREGVDLVHSVNNVLPLSLPVPGVVTVHDLSPFVVPRRFGMLKRLFLRWAVPRSVRRARAVIAVSDSTRRDLLRFVRGAEPEKIRVVTEGADGRFHPRRDPAWEERLRRSHDLPPEFLLTVGADEPGKNLAGIAAALEVLREQEGLTPPWVIAGDRGRAWARLAARLSRTPLAGQVRHLGLVPAEDLPHLYRMAAVFVFPSLHEGFGLPVLEALSCGAPTITSRLSSLPEVAGRAALTVNPARPEEIARALRRVLLCPRLRALLSERGPIQSRKFSWEEAARETARVYRSALH